MSTTTTVPTNLPRNAKGEAPIGYINAHPYQVSFPLRNGAAINLDGNQQVMDEATHKRVTYHPELEALVAKRDLKRLYPSDLQAQPKPKLSQRETNAARTNEETHQRLHSTGAFKPESGLPTTSVSSDRGIQDQAPTKSPTSRPATLEEATSEGPNVARIVAAERSALPAQKSEGTANTMPSVVMVTEDGLPLAAVQQENGSYLFEGKPYTSGKALSRFLKQSGRTLRVADAAELDPEAS